MEWHTTLIIDLRGDERGGEFAPKDGSGDVTPDYSNYKSNAKDNEELIQDLDKKLQELGIKKEKGYATSHGDYGTSYYITVYDKEGNEYKFRVSNHSVENISRMQNEIHLTKDNIGEKITEVERRFYPERFEKGIQQVRIREDYLKPSDKVVKEDGKMGNKKILIVDREIEGLNKKRHLIKK